MVDGNYLVPSRDGSKRGKRGPLRHFVLQFVLPYGMLLLGLVFAFFRLQAIEPVTEVTRVFNRRVGNPAMMRLAGRRYWFAGVIRHRGRRSGRKYATPVWAVPTTDGFLIALPFGEGVDWLKNVRAAGRATVGARGETWSVAEPEVLDREAARSLLPWHARLLFDLAGIGRYLMLRRSSVSDQPASAVGDARTTGETPA